MAADSVCVYACQTVWRQMGGGGGGGDWAARWQAIDFYSHKATAWATATATVTVNGKLHKRRSLRCSSYENPIFQ